MNHEAKSCGNCRHLSRPAEIEFQNHKIESRVICLKSCWNSKSSVLLISIYKKSPKRYRDIAEKCSEYCVQDESSALRNSTIETAKK
jgi:hypothetical protein